MWIVTKNKAYPVFGQDKGESSNDDVSLEDSQLTILSKTRAQYLATNPG